MLFREINAAYFENYMKHRNILCELCLPPAFTLISYLAYFSLLKMDAIFSSETSVDFQRNTRHYIPKDRTIRYS
jgi:hypothetical protein